MFIESPFLGLGLGLLHPIIRSVVDINTHDLKVLTLVEYVKKKMSTTINSADYILVEENSDRSDPNVNGLPGLLFQVVFAVHGVVHYQLIYT